MVHLTNDNGVAAFRAQKNHLGGAITEDAGSHLVVIKQTTNWSNKEFVVTPYERKYFCAWAVGEELFPNQRGGSQVFNDTNQLINRTKSIVDQHPKGWKNGDCAIFSVSGRGDGPAACYEYNNGGVWFPDTRSEYGASFVAYKMDLRHLHLSMMGTNFKAYLRCWAPSLVVGEITELPDAGILIASGLYNQASNLKMKFFSTLPDLTSLLCETGDGFEFGNNANNGRRVTADTEITDCMCQYWPFGGQDPFEVNGNTTRIYTLQDNWDSPMPSPTNYYHDFEITNSNNLNFLKNNPGDFWMVMHFHLGNGFAEGSVLDRGLGPNQTATVFCERAELVLKCTNPAFNQN